MFFLWRSLSRRLTVESWERKQSRDQLSKASLLGFHNIGFISNKRIQKTKLQFSYHKSAPGPRDIIAKSSWSYVAESLGNYCRVLVKLLRVAKHGVFVNYISILAVTIWLWPIVTVICIEPGKAVFWLLPPCRMPSVHLNENYSLESSSYSKSF